MNIFNTGLLGAGARKGKGVEIPIESGDETSKKDDKSSKIKKEETSSKPIQNASTASETDKQSVTEKVETSSKETDNQEEKKLPPRKTVKVSKVGVEHTRCNVNNQDFSFSFMNLKVITDGCGSGKHSEVGTRLFGQLFSREVVKFMECVKTKNVARVKKYVVGKDMNDLATHIENGEIPEEAFTGIVNAVLENMLYLCSDTAFIFENYCFTILACLEYEDEFVVYSCGDGYIITEDAAGIAFEKLDDGEFPAYYIYNWINPEKLSDYKEGVDFKVSHYPKDKYINVGVASDGLRYFGDLYEPEQCKFLEMLSNGKTAQIEMLVNRNNQKRSIFQDDLSICF